MDSVKIKAACGDVLRWRAPVETALAAYAINTEPRESMFLAQCAHESEGFTRLVENLRYQSSTLLRVFGKYFTPTEALRMAFDERAIAERVYGGRMGNNIEGLGDGFRFRGRGVIQLTGRANYRECGKAIGMDLEEHPDALLEPAVAVLSAAWFWATRGCNELADADDFEGITRKINGGVNGLEDRERWLAKIRAA